MFDDEAPQQSSEMPPASVANAAMNTDEVPDIFDGSAMDAPASGEHMADFSPETSIHGPSALDSGKLQRIDEAPKPMGMGAMDQNADLHEPTAIKRILIATIVLIIVGVIGVAVWYFVVRTPAKTPAIVTAPVANTEAEKTPEVVPVVSAPPTQGEVDVDVTQPTPEPPPIIEKPADVPLPTAPEIPQKDSDKDGLTDEQEAKLGTDPANPDTDADGLNDSAEVNIWGTDPLNKDTDGDTFSDGQEVLNGFNPKGAGKAQ